MQERVKKLIDFQKRNRYSDTKMAYLLDVCYGTYWRWIHEETKPTVHSHIKNIDRLLNEQN